MEVVALLGRGACFKAPFSNSISSACRPTIRSRAAILASYSCSRSAACTSSSRAPASNLPTQIRISCREDRYVQLRGTVTRVTEDEAAAAHIDSLAHKYLGVDKNPYAKAGDVRVMFEITVFSVQGMG